MEVLSANVVFSGTDLGVVEVRQTLGSEALGQLTLDDDVLHLVAQQLVVDVA